MRKFIVVVVLSFSAITAHSQWDNTITSEYKFYGFSADLKYAAFETDMLLPNSQTLTSVYVVNVDKNSYAMKHFEYAADSADQPDFVAAYKKIVALTQSQFLISGTDHGVPIQFGPESNGSYSFKVGAEEYRLTINNIPIKTNRDGVMEDDGEVMVEVDLAHGSNVKVLQKPERAPESWGQTFKYTLIAGYRLGTKIAIFLQYSVAGFEGPGKESQMIVTGVLN